MGCSSCSLATVHVHILPRLALTVIFLGVSLTHLPMWPVNATACRSQSSLVCPDQVPHLQVWVHLLRLWQWVPAPLHHHTDHLQGVWHKPHVPRAEAQGSPHLWTRIAAVAAGTSLLPGTPLCSLWMLWTMPAIVHAVSVSCDVIAQGEAQRNSYLWQWAAALGASTHCFRVYHSPVSLELRNTILQTIADACGCRLYTCAERQTSPISTKGLHHM